MTHILANHIPLLLVPARVLCCLFDCALCAPKTNPVRLLSRGSQRPPFIDLLLSLASPRSSVCVLCCCCLLRVCETDLAVESTPKANETQPKRKKSNQQKRRKRTKDDQHTTTHTTTHTHTHYNTAQPIASRPPIQSGIVLLPLPLFSVPHCPRALPGHVAAQEVPTAGWSRGGE